MEKTVVDAILKSIREKKMEVQSSLKSGAKESTGTKLAHYDLRNKFPKLKTKDHKVRNSNLSLKLLERARAEAERKKQTRAKKLQKMWEKQVNAYSKSSVQTKLSTQLHKTHSVALSKRASETNINKMELKIFNLALTTKIYTSNRYTNNMNTQAVIEERLHTTPSSQSVDNVREFSEIPKRLRCRDLKSFCCSIACLFKHIVLLIIGTDPVDLITNGILYVLHKVQELCVDNGTFIPRHMMGQIKRKRITPAVLGPSVDEPILVAIDRLGYLYKLIVQWLAPLLRNPRQEHINTDEQIPTSLNRFTLQHQNQRTVQVLFKTARKYKAITERAGNQF